MPFGLKNAGATYQCVATTLLHDLIQKEVKFYVNDMIVKSKNRERAHTGFEEVLWKNRILQVMIESKEVHFQSNIRKAIGVYCKLVGNRSWSWLNQGNCRNEASKNWKGDPRISGEDTVQQ